MSRVRVGILGANGFGGSELLRILLFHPHVEVTHASSRRLTGRPVWEELPNLRGATDLAFCPYEPGRVAREVDVLISALPHGGVAATACAEAVAANRDLRVIDLSGDFRLKDPALHEKFYGKHAAPQLAKEFVYGLPEFFREEIKGARRVANPGCFATATLLSLLPLAQAGLLSGWVVVDAATGSTGLGAAPTARGHHPFRSDNFRAYNMLNHRHMPEVLQAVGRVSSSGIDLSFVPHSAPMVRGIYATAHARLPAGTDAGRVEAAYREAYAAASFVRLLGPGASPESRVVARTNFADLSWTVGGDRCVALCALDNLVKGEAGQAVQNLNLMHGWDERTGLTWPGTTP